jgi:AraC family transcriptional regulator
VDRSPRSAIPFLDSRSGRRVDALRDARLIVSSQRLGWPGVLVEAGDNAIWEVDDLTVAHHYVAMNTAAASLSFEVREPNGFRRVTLEPGSVWFCPAGEAFTHRVAEPCEFAAVSIAPSHFEHLVGADGNEISDGAPHIDLRRAYSVRTPQMEYLTRALVVEADRGNPSGLPFVEALVTAVSLQIVQLAGVRAPRAASVRGGLSSVARRRVLELIDARLEQGVSIDELAREAGLSPSHFMRAFKQAFGHPPHRHILTQRLERARWLIEQADASLSDIALRTGFADQAHFTRLFKRQFGVTPGAILRRRIVR